MTKKQKKKVIVKIFPGEAIFVASADILEHISLTYMMMARECEDPNDARSWSSVSEDIQSWLKKTYYSGESNEYEEEE